MSSQVRIIRLKTVNSVLPPCQELKANDMQIPEMVMHNDCTEGRDDAFLLSPLKIFAFRKSVLYTHSDNALYLPDF